MALNMSAALNITANVQGAQTVSALNNQLQQLGQQGEKSAKQLKQAYMQLPAQLQDVAVSLAGGQNPLMVLLQQGSQVSTQFGGVGNAIRGVAAIITPAKIAFAGLAGAVGAFAVAAFQGYQEGIQLQKQLAITGNFAGMTADSFERAAARIQRATGATAAATREMLMGAAGSGSFGPASIDAVTQAMTRLQRLTGQSTEDVVKLFSGMRNGVANWAAEANKSYNFLTVEQYKYIKLLEEQGRQEQAMKVAADALNSSLSGRTIELGYLERAWKGVKEGASNAWNAMMNIGRPDTLADQIAAIEARLRNSQAIRDGMRRRGQPVPDEGPEIAALKAQLEALREQARLSDRAAEATANRGRANQQAIDAERKAEETRKRALSEAESKEKQRLALIQGVRDEVLKLTKGEDELTIARLRGLGASQKQIEDLEEQLRLRQAAVNSQQVLDLFKGMADEVNKLAKSEEELFVAKLKAAGATDEEIEQGKTLVAQLMAQRAEKKRLEDATKSAEAAAKQRDQQDKEREQVLQGLNDQITSLVYGEDALTIARMRNLGATDEEIESVRNLQRELQLLRKLKDGQREADALRESVRTPEEKLADDLARFKKMYQEGTISIETYTRAVGNARDAYVELGKKGDDVMSELKKAIEGWGKSAADAFVKFAFGAKESTKSVREQFSEMVNAVLQDIARMLVYKNITQPLFSAISGMLPFANGGVMTANGPLPLNAYSRGGIANSPQLALFGEGRMPEAYVPLPDGRSIPVTMQGGGGTNVVVNVNMETGQEQSQGDDQRGTDLGLVIASVVKQELINQRRPGGLLAA